MRAVVVLASVCLVSALDAASSASARAGCPAGLPAPGGGATFNVTTTADSGAGSFRRALNLAGPNAKILFAAAMCGQTFTLLAPLPNVAAGNLFIRGCEAGAEPRFVPDTAVFGAGSGITFGSNSNFMCGLRFESFPGSGILVLGGARNVIQGNVAVGNLAAGIRIANQGASGDNVLLDNLVGVAGTIILGNCAGAAACGGIEVGALLAGTADHTTVKGNVVVATRGHGIFVRGGRRHVMAGNFVGTDTAGASGLGNDGDGIVVDTTTRVSIEDNVVAANARAGLRVVASTRTDIIGNLVGVADAASLLGGGNGADGILIDGCADFAIGGHGGGADRNVVSDNGAHGVHVVASQAGTIAGNYVGTDASGLLPLGNHGAGIVVDSMVALNIGGPSQSHRNVVGANHLGNVIVAGGAHVVRHNIVGVGVDGLTPLITLVADCSGLAGSGIVVLSGAVVRGNLVALNACDGILVTSSGAPADVAGNVVGLPGRGNARHGIHVMAGGAHRIGSVGHPNVVAFNGADGIHVGISALASADIDGNEVRMNAGSGIALADDPGVSACRLRDNAVAENARHGIDVGARSTGNTLLRNTLWDNGGCALHLAPGANNGIVPPTVTFAGAGAVAGTVVEPVAVGVAAQATRPVAGHIDVFAGDGPRAPALRWIGSLNVAAGTPSWSLPIPAAVPAQATFVATFTDAVTGDTSALAESCGGADEDCDGAVDEPFDFDLDGSTTCGGDCADDDPALEGLDADQDGSTTCDGDCDDDDPAVEALDVDLDGASTCGGDCNDCVPELNLRDDDLDTTNTCDGDCDDDDPSRSAVDGDGDGFTSCSYSPDCDDSVLGDMVDADGDGRVLCHGECDAAVVDDADGDGFTTCDGDCDDTDRRLTPWDPDGDGFSTCTLPLDCDDDPSTHAVDPDGDGTPCFIDCDESDYDKSCADHDGDGLASCAGCGLPLDCDDREVGAASVAEVQDFADNDCDGFIDEGFDFDGDGAPSCAGAGCDCDDHDPRARPGSSERCDDGIDNDCDALTADVGSDVDGDGWLTCAGPASPIDPNDNFTDPTVSCSDLDRDGATLCDALPDCVEGDPGQNRQDFDEDGYTSCDGDCDDSDVRKDPSDDDIDGTSTCAGDCDDLDSASATDCAGARAAATFYVDVVPLATAGAFAFDPPWTWIHRGDTVVWRFAAPPPDSVATDAIIPVDRIGDGPELCTAYRPDDPADEDDFTGPMPHLVSGVLTLGPDGAGYVEETAGPNTVCAHALAPTRVGPTASVAARHLCDGGPDYASLESTWADPGVTGVFIRLRWDDVNPAQGVFDWSALDREMDQAVSHGKVFSIAYKAGAGGTPDWIFDDALGLGDCNQVKALDFVHSEDDSPCIAMTLGSPLDPSYECHYFALLSATAEHIRSRNAWYRALAYVKLSGANVFTQEARLPRGCDCDGCACNDEIWAKATLADGTPRPYTPSGLYRFFRRQEAHLKALFPDKELSYQLINNGYPQVDGDVYESCVVPDDLAQPCTSNGVLQGVSECAVGVCLGSCPPASGNPPGPNAQTEEIMRQGRTDDNGEPAEDAYRFAVQHNGLRPITANDPNSWAVTEGCFGQPTGYQTGNASEKVANPYEVDLALQGELVRSSGMFFETYEQRVWEIRATLADAVLDPLGSNLSLAGWAWLFHQRRIAQNTLEPWLWQVPDPFPATHSHTFASAPAPETRYRTYVHGSGCARTVVPEFGVIAILPVP